MKKLSEEKQAILIYSGELLLFSIIFIVLGVLKFTRVIGYNETRRIVFNWITLAGGVWGITDFTWALVSKRRRAKTCFIDKSLTLVLALSMICYDMISLIGKPAGESFYINFLAGALVYAGAGGINKETKKDSLKTEGNILMNKEDLKLEEIKKEHEKEADKQKEETKIEK